MIYQKIGKYVRKAFTLGPKKTVQLIANKVQQTSYQKYLRSQAIARKVSWDWKRIAAQHHYKESFECYFDTVRSQIEFEQHEILPLDLNNEMILEKADAFLNNCFDLLGSGNQCFTKIPWHQDFRCAQTSPDVQNNFQLDYYKDIKITVGQTDQLEKDIKVPWELSRFQHLIVMGKAYELTADEKYAIAFSNQIDDWLHNNPVLLGANWACAMDGAIRALNWIWAFRYFKNSPSVSIDFWERFFCSLYDHLEYLEHNWEIYDLRTSNHYFSDLIGYYYLCYFFKSLSSTFIKKASWSHDALKAEFEKQVFDEGTDYEGSTAYHGLITEIVHHYFFISNLFSFEILNVEKEKFDRMREFIDWCTISKDEIIKIGDDDSGKILYFGISRIMKKSDYHVCDKKDYKQFGLSIYKNNRFHVTLRHHSYQHMQPSGHHHYDVGSMTLAVNGIPVFVDPGSFVYTPSAFWRNYFRSVKMHNTIYLDNQEPVALDDRLFTLDLPEKIIHNIISGQENLLSTSFYLYPNATLHRSIEILDDSIIITDSCTLNEHANYKTMHWNFTLHPEIEVQQQENEIVLLHNATPLLQIESELIFTVHDSFYSPAYGIKVPCKRLVGYQHLRKETGDFKNKMLLNMQLIN